MINFKEHDGLLFKMLDKPVPLTPDAEMPCLVRLIQDDSPMGKYNQSYSEYRYGVELGCCMLPIIATHIAKNGVVNDVEWDVSRYEIIGTFVEEGSKEWALYQMMQGKMVCHKTSRWDWYRMYSDHAIHNRTAGCMPRVSAWLESTVQSGWEIYKEPKPESENIIHGHIPADMHLKYIHLFKVGDWVECKDLAGVPAQCKVLEIRKHNVILECKTGHIWSLPHNNIIRKLKPSEIVVRIGCLSGTIAKSCEPACFLMWHSNPKMDFDYSVIRFSALDTETRSLVESLLKAQKEEE